MQLLFKFLIKIFTFNCANTSVHVQLYMYNVLIVCMYNSKQKLQVIIFYVSIFVKMLSIESIESLYWEEIYNCTMYDVHIQYKTKEHLQKWIISYNFPRSGTFFFFFHFSFWDLSRSLLMKNYIHCLLVHTEVGTVYNSTVSTHY